MKKLLLMRTWLLATIAVFAFGSISAQTIIYSADFDQNDDTHQTGNNSYTVDSKSYKASSVDWTITYADVCNPSTAISGYSCIGRVAKNTTNSPTMTTGAFGSGENTVTEISYDVKGNTNITVTCYTSTDGLEWTEQHSEAATAKTSTVTINNLNITAPIYLKFTGTVESSTKSNRDFAIDNVVVKGISNTLPSITVSPAALDFGKSIDGYDSRELTVTAANLTEDIAINWKDGINNRFNFDKSIHFTREGGAISIYFTGSEVGKYNATLVLTSGSVSTEVPITAEIIALAGTGAGTEANPYDVTRAFAIIDTLPSGESTDDVYVVGKIKEISEVSTQFGNATYTIVNTDDSDSDKVLTVYRGKYLNGDSFTSEDQIGVNDIVVVKGKLTLYEKDGNKTYEFTSGNELISIEKSTITDPNPNVTYVMLVGKAQNGKYYAVSNKTGAVDNSLAAVQVAVVNNKVMTSKVNDNLLWMVEGQNIVSKNGKYLSASASSTNLSTSDSSSDWVWDEERGYWTKGSRTILGLDDEKGNYYFKTFATSNINKYVKNTGYYFATPAVEMAYKIANVATEGEHTIIDVVVEVLSTLPVNHIAKDNDGNWVANKIVINDEKDHILNREVNASSVEYLRKLSGEAWSAICLPFAVTANDLDGYDVLELKGIENDMVAFTYVDAMAAHAPYLIKKKDNSKNGNVEFKLTDTTVEGNATAKKVTETATLVGIYTAQPVPAGCYGLAKGEFRKAADDNDNELKPFRAYLVLTNAPQGAQMMSISIDDQATGIENINIADEVIFYDLQGRRVNNPSKGIFIMNGKKVIIK